VNDVFRVSLDRVLLSTSQVALLIDLFEGYSVHYLVLGLSAGSPEGEGLAIINLQKKLEESSAERRRPTRSSQKAQADLDQELAALRDREGELFWLQGTHEEKIIESERKFSELG